MSAGRSLRLATVLALALAPSLARAAVAADPFYLGLLRDGVAAYDRKDFPKAARDLRLACFGLLDEPAPLGDCLVRLAVAQGAAGDAEGFQATFGRLAEVEERFGVYRQLALPPDLRNAFEERAAATVPPSTLAAVPTFAGLASRRAAAQWAALPAKERRRQLEARLAKDPRDAAANRLLAELDFDEGKIAQALARAEQAAALTPQDPGALCLRGVTRAWARRCKEAVADLGPCARSVREPRYATALLGCWVELGEWREAQGVVDALPPELRGERQISTLVARVEQHAAEKPRAAVAGRTGAPPPAAPPPAAALSPAERASLERTRSLFKSPEARDLKQAFDLARAVADAHPEAREAQLLAGEAAYRNSRWREAVSYLRRAGGPPENRPELLFYLAVSLYESGDAPGAATALRRALPGLQRSPYVELYTRRILGPGNG